MLNQIAGYVQIQAAMPVDMYVLNLGNDIQLSIFKNLCNFSINFILYKRSIPRTPFRYFVVQKLKGYTNYFMGQVLPTFTSTEAGMTLDFSWYNKAEFSTSAIMKDSHAWKGITVWSEVLFERCVVYHSLTTSHL